MSVESLLPSSAAVLTILGMLAATYSTRLIGFFLLRGKKLSPKMQNVFDMAPGCVIISVIAPYFISGDILDLCTLIGAALLAARFNMFVTVVGAIALYSCLKILFF